MSNDIYENIPGSIGKQLAAIRTRLQLTQAEVTGKYFEGHGLSWLAMIETGSRKINLEDLYKLCTIYKVSPHTLLGPQVVFVYDDAALLDSAAPGSLVTNYKQDKNNYVVPTAYEYVRPDIISNWSWCFILRTDGVDPNGNNIQVDYLIDTQLGPTHDSKSILTSKDFPYIIVGSVDSTEKTVMFMYDTKFETDSAYDDVVFIGQVVEITKKIILL